MVAWSSLKWAVAATCAAGLTQVEALPAAASRDGTMELSSGLLRRQKNNFYTFSGVQQGLGPAPDQVPLRKEIREMIQNPTEFNLFLLALQRFYQMPQKDEKSFFGIAGIHGRPFKPWDNVPSGKGDAKSGYCTHKDVLFLPWHRPYLALYEQLVWEHARDIVNEFPEPKKAAYKAVLPTLRIPYWDWAVNSTIPDEVGTFATIKIDTPKGQQTIPNPLYSYKFTDLSEFSDFQSPYAKMNETVRYPQIVDGVYSSQIDPLNRVMENAAGSLTNTVYKILTTYKDFSGVSTSAYNRHTGRPVDSFESVHDNIHQAIGGPIGGPSGHMTDISMAAFDPIFWLHHTNIDRLFAIWQEVNPTGYNFSSTSSFGTFTMDSETPESLDTPLTPFHQTGTAFYTSATIARTQKFGYTYPETNDWNIPQQDRVKSVIAAINRIYGQDTPAGALSAALALPVPPGSNLPVMFPTNQPLNTPPPPSVLAGYKKSVVQDGKYYEWTTEIQVNHASLNGNVRVFIFLGDVPNQPNQWDTSKSFLGSFSVWTMKSNSHDAIVHGTVPLTSALLNKIVSSEVENLKRETVTPYLLKNLKCKVAGPNGIVDIKTIADLKVSVSYASVTLPKSESDAPTWDTPEVAINMIDVPKGVFTPVQN
ncbi:Tyrosinase [Drechslerella dactyloides]|uniref:tyrosinase n=1 Tax=Drechslerella dactyloides TaxID=74499 RepID=A0AAD6J3Z0_DREDA|nr:Tyrosinase [Drechslerella dactyloides]